MYEENLKIDIKSKISQKGYTVGEIELEILNNDEYTLNDNNEKSEPSILSESEKRKLKEYLSSVYEVNENNIVVN